MVGEDTVTMSAKDLRRTHVMRQVLDGTMHLPPAGTVAQLPPDRGTAGSGGAQDINRTFLNWVDTL